MTKNHEHKVYTPGLHEPHEPMGEVKENKVEEKIRLAAEAAGIVLSLPWERFFRALHGDETVTPPAHEPEPSAH